MYKTCQRGIECTKTGKFGRNLPIIGLGACTKHVRSTLSGRLIIRGELSSQTGQIINNNNQTVRNTKKHGPIISIIGPRVSGDCAANNLQKSFGGFSMT